MSVAKWVEQRASWAPIAHFGEGRGTKSLASASLCSLIMCERSCKIKGYGQTMYEREWTASSCARRGHAEGKRRREAVASRSRGDARRQRERRGLEDNRRGKGGK